MMQRVLGRSGVEVGAIGMGCWAIGGSVRSGGQVSGWGQVDDVESTRAIKRALDLGATLFDTADSYGCGHSERVLGRALGARRDEAVIATKVGNVFDESTREILGQSGEPEYIRQACEASLTRLGVDRIDLYQLHTRNLTTEQAAAARDAMEDLVSEGKVRWYGWSTDDPGQTRLYAAGAHCTAVQQSFSVFGGNDETLAACEELNLASLNRGPLAKGVLTGKFTADSTFPADDSRSRWNMREGQRAQQLATVESLRAVLTEGGRTPGQGALCWLLVRSEKMLPIPGFKTVAQVEQNAAAADFGPLSADQMRRIDEILGR